MGMERDILKNQLLNIRNIVNRSINNHLYNSTSTNTDSENVNNTNVDSENINNMNSNNENSNNENNSNPTNMYHNLNFTYPSSINRSNLFSNPELVEITLFNNERRVVNNLEDVPIYPSLRTLRDTSSISIYSEIDTEQETCSICRD